MLRSYVKLVWNIDYSELVKAIHFESPKAQFVQMKVTDYRSSLDTFRISREAKLREFVYPFVKYARQNNIVRSVEMFFIWKRFHVKSEKYNLVFEIEQVYGTSSWLYQAALRANNENMSEIAKNKFSPLFHTNRNPNYAKMDIHSDYLTESCKAKAPKFYEYLKLRKNSNFTKEKFSAEPYDERHEEFNKRGVKIQTNKTIEDFQQSFQLIDHYNEVKEKCFEDYDIKSHGGNVITIPEYEDNIRKMRVCMRKSKYLNNSMDNEPFTSISDSDQNPELKNIISRSQNQKIEDVLNVLRHHDFEKGYSNDAHLCVLKEETKDKLDMNFATQIRILIESEPDLEQREQMRDYHMEAQKKTSFDEEKFVEDLLSHEYVYL